jgi:crotonobetainyl-CoA:carnitine CoA-transferase CaiB-like acyl-CoA transferase
MPPIQAKLREKRTAYWIDLLESCAVPCGPINTIDQVFEDAQVKHRGTRRVLHHPTAGSVAVVANPVRMSNHDTTAQKAPPMLGEDTASVLREVLGMDTVEIAKFT